MGLRARHTPEAIQTGSRKRRKPKPRDQSPEREDDIVRALQQSLGNQAMRALVENGGLQGKLRVGGSGDPAEREADRIANEVTNGSASDPPISSKKPYSPAPAREFSSREAPNSSSAPGGRELPRSVRASFEPRFGADFSDVRVHDDRNAHELTRSLNARAITYGSSMYFAPGEYRPGTSAGNSLLAHELTHVLQQTGGHQPGHPTAVTQANALLASENVDGPVIQRQPAVESEPANTDWDLTDDDSLTPEERVDDATWQGFSLWWESASADARSTLEDSADVGAALSSPYAERFSGLRADLEGIHLLIENGVSFLRSGYPAPWLTADPIGLADELEASILAVYDVAEAWRAVLWSGLLELMATFGEAQLLYAQALQDELRACRWELEELSAAFTDPAVREALAQFSINAAITTALFVLTITNPLVGVGVAVAGAAAQLTFDQLLGPSEPGPESFTAAGASTAGAAAENLNAGKTMLRFGGKTLGVVGAISGTSLDAVEVYQANKARLVRVGQRFQELAHKLEPLRPLLRYPEMARAIIDGLRDQAARLREEGQLVLAGDSP